MDSVGDACYQFAHHELLPKGTGFILGWPLYIHLQGADGRLTCQCTSSTSVTLLSRCHVTRSAHTAHTRAKTL